MVNGAMAIDLAVNAMEFFAVSDFAVPGHMTTRTPPAFRRVWAVLCVMVAWQNRALHAPCGIRKFLPLNDHSCSNDLVCLLP